MLALLALKLKKMKSNFIIVIIKSIIRAIAFGVLWSESTILLPLQIVLSSSGLHFMLTLTRVISDCVSVTRTGNVTPDSVTSVSLARSYYGEPGKSPVDASC